MSQIRDGYQQTTDLLVAEPASGDLAAARRTVERHARARSWPDGDRAAVLAMLALDGAA
jgi:hypothetical protein